MRLIILLVALFHIYMFNAQQITKTLTPINEIKGLAKSQNKFSWAVPISKTEKITLQWQERKTSFTDKEGIRSFVGYKDDNLVGVVSILSGKISGSIRWKENEITLSTSSDGFLILESKVSKNECATCTDQYCESHIQPTLQTSVSKNILAQTTLTTNDNTQKMPLEDDGVLRVYRLALAISNKFFNEEFQSKMDNVKMFWANTEVGLNEIYMRDLGIKFEVLKDEKLVITDLSKDPYRYGARDTYVLSTSTREINKLIGEESYDMGVFFFAYNGTSVGAAYSSFGYFKENKASAAVRGKDLNILAHEIGHLLGASHIHSKTSRSSGYSHKTELENGQSIMGYGWPKNFFSLVSLQDIRSDLFRIPYYTDFTKAVKIGEKRIPQEYDNFPVGIPTTNKAPIIDTRNLKAEYLLPAGTFFGFHINATDPDNDSLLYAVHQVDKVIKGDASAKSFAKFYTHKPTENNYIFFQDDYASAGHLEYSINTVVNDTYNFWIGVNDGKNAHQKENHATRYDIFETKIKVTDAKPFIFTEGGKVHFYKQGQKVTLKWQVDEKIFKNTKVRILLSDDFGETFKYVLEESTENDGIHEVVIPQVNIGRIKYKNNITMVRAGVFKIEVIDHIAYALSALDPYNSNRTAFTGGFIVEPSSITFTNVPEPKITITEGETIPEPHNVQATTICRGNLKGKILLEEKKTQIRTGEVITRTWTAEDYCGTKASYVQHIFVNKRTEKLQFTGELPKDRTISCHQNVPVEELRVSGGCSPTVTVSDVIKSRACANSYVIERTYTASDKCGSQPTTYTQNITVTDTEIPTFIGTLPKDTTVIGDDNIPTQETLYAKDNCTTGVKVKESQEESEENGNRVVIYKWTATDDCGNTAEHTQRIKVEKGLSAVTHTTDNANKPLLYPNPVSNVFYLNNIKDVVSVSIYNEEGRLIKTFEKSQSSYDVSNLKTGNYILRVHTKNENINIKWIKL